MFYLIFAQICSAVGTPDWVIILCYVMFGFNMIANIIKEVAKTIKEKKWKGEK